MSRLPFDIAIMIYPGSRRISFIISRSLGCQDGRETLPHVRHRDREYVVRKQSASPKCALAELDILQLHTWCRL